MTRNDIKKLGTNIPFYTELNFSLKTQKTI